MDGRWRDICHNGLRRLQGSFQTDDYAIHLREQGPHWVIDTVNDRGQRRNCDAKFSNFDLAEKYLLWEWVTVSHSHLASGPLGADLYQRGFAPGVEVSRLDDGRIKVCFNGDCAVLIAGDATIFSHIMKMSVSEIFGFTGKAAT
jgi:hypothetical protein